MPAGLAWKPAEEGGLLGAGGDDFQVAEENVEEWGWLIEPVQTQHPPDWRHARIVGGRPHFGVGAMAIGHHRAKLENPERLAADIGVAELPASRDAAPIDANPRLGVEHRAARGEFDGAR